MILDEAMVAKIQAGYHPWRQELEEYTELLESWIVQGFDEALEEAYAPPLLAPASSEGDELLAVAAYVAMNRGEDGAGRARAGRAAVVLDLARWARERGARSAADALSQAVVAFVLASWHAGDGGAFSAIVRATQSDDEAKRVASAIVDLAPARRRQVTEELVIAHQAAGLAHAAASHQPEAAARPDHRPRSNGSAVPWRTLLVQAALIVVPIGVPLTAGGILGTSALRRTGAGRQPSEETPSSERNPAPSASNRDEALGVLASWIGSDGLPAKGYSKTGRRGWTRLPEGREKPLLALIASSLGPEAGRTREFRTLEALPGQQTHGLPVLVMTIASYFPAGTDAGGLDTTQYNIHVTVLQAQQKAAVVEYAPSSYETIVVDPTGESWIRLHDEAQRPMAREIVGPDGLDDFDGDGVSELGYFGVRGKRSMMGADGIATMVWKSAQLVLVSTRYRSLIKIGVDEQTGYARSVFCVYTNPDTEETSFVTLTRLYKPTQASKDLKDAPLVSTGFRLGDWVSSRTMVRNEARLDRLQCTDALSASLPTPNPAANRMVWSSMAAP